MGGGVEREGRNERFHFENATQDGSGGAMYGRRQLRRSRGKSEIILRRVRVARCLFPSKRA